MTLLSRRNVEPVLAGLGVYCLTLLIVVAGIVFGHMAVERSAGPHAPLHVPQTGNVLTDTLTLWDGQWYLEIAQRGYSYDPKHESSVADFPGYPLLITAISKPTGMPSSWAALAVSHLFLIGSFVLLFVYARENMVDQNQVGAPTGTCSARRSPLWTLLAFGLFPPTLFMRMAYTESLFVFLSILAMYGINRNWRPWQIALVVGASTAVRSTGVAILLPLAVYAWNRDTAASAAGSRDVSPSRFAHFVCPAFRALLVATIALSGLIAYMGYQYATLGEPLAFVKTQGNWHNRESKGLGEKAAAIVSLEPIWGAYIPSSPAYVRNCVDPAPPLLSLQFANPLLFVLAVVLVGVGAWKKWLTRYEVLLAAGLLLIPYATRAYEMCMACQGRYSSVAFPIYIVMGNVLNRLPRHWAIAILVLFAAYLAIYSAMLAAGFVLI